MYSSNSRTYFSGAKRNLHPPQVEASSGDGAPAVLVTPARSNVSLRGRSTLLTLPDLPITKTIDEVIVYHSNRLHVRINDRRADEAEPPVLEVLAECVGFG
jgi:hypothetical protein